jgi:two-component system phosphate regulon response regulator PhoB
MMPGFSGTEVLKELQNESVTGKIPVVMLTAKGDEVDRVLGLELGAEDYVTKPFSVRELLLRIRKILERVDSRDEDRLLRCNGITLDSDRYEVRVSGAPVRLTITEFNLLVFLLKNKGRVLSRDKLLERVWGYRYGGTTRTVDTHIQRLREKLGTEAQCIETIRGVGYRLEPTQAGA